MTQDQARTIIDALNHMARLSESQKREYLAGLNDLALTPKPSCIHKRVSYNTCVDCGATVERQ